MCGNDDGDREKPVRQFSDAAADDDAGPFHPTRQRPCMTLAPSAILCLSVPRRVGGVDRSCAKSVMCKGQAVVLLTMGERCVVSDSYGWIMDFPLVRPKMMKSVQVDC